MKKLFRGFDTEIHRWVTGGITDDQQHIIVSNDEGDFDSIHVDPQSVCQFTDICDKNNTPVYEDDILHDGTNYYTISYVEGQYCVDTPNGIIGIKKFLLETGAVVVGHLYTEPKLVEFVFSSSKESEIV